ncbi:MULTISPECIES: oligopeptide transporter, OPT family [Oleiagrimonas]|uniref:Oligopeptide transporter, OPT family n=1 Tax=Oleiagrimonas citrea TaxID=1665687 RepID=A0A846ZMT4_9GAMM|nr:MULTISPECIES: oligopeptide transporter, OPT family [Oleiagrimonas]NKZ38890.1 oligopeptide transporter, OPT family [Oleiagrimonas citrea]RAP59742.1 oligopeptide transporter, OPT family [Oleiagrimonas sp. MCCC 1A03011]
MTPQSELTLRGVIIGVLITLVFTAANVYFGLEAGLTFATSIPAAVISMAVLRKVSDATIQENNIVQTIASAAGCLSAIIFVLPGMVIVGWWAGFPYWETAAICGLGGILGVMYSIPLRRALVTNSDLPYPEGVACAEVLKVGDSHRSADADADAAEVARSGFRAVVVGALVSAGFAVVEATRIFAKDVSAYFHVGDRGAATGFDFSLSFALLAVGHLVGLWVGVSMLLGTLIAWGWAVPHYTLLAHATGTAAEVAGAAFGQKVRFLGAGTIAAAAVWTLLKLVKPVYTGLTDAMRSTKLRKSGQGASLPRTEHDLPIGIVAVVTLVCMLPIAWLLGDFSVGAGLGSQMWLLVIGGVVFIALMSFFVASVCGYMAGLVGSSNSPLSGIGILVIVIASVLLALGVQSSLPPEAGKALVAFALFASSVVFAGATIANDNLQDLKTGQLVDATPWKQQVALVIGVIAGALIIPFVMNMLNQAYGFVGAANATKDALAAPQAGLISALAQGVLQHNIEWSLIWTGAGIGAVIIVIDELLGLRGTSMRLPPLAVGLGIYLPSEITLMIVVGAFVGWYFDRRAARAPKPAATRQLGVLMSSGLIVGESIIGVIIAAIVVFSGNEHPLALVGDGFEHASVWVGGAAFIAVLAALYMWVSRLGRPNGAR